MDATEIKHARFGFAWAVNCEDRIHMKQQDTQEKNHVKFCDMDVAGI